MRKRSEVKHVVLYAFSKFVLMKPPPMKNVRMLSPYAIMVMMRNIIVAIFPVSQQMPMQNDVIEGIRVIKI